MAYRKVIEVNPLSMKSINNAKRELREAVREIEQRRKMMMLHLAEKCKDSLNKRFDAVGRRDVEVSYLVFDNGNSFTLLANGEQVAFVEFGAGAEAGVGVYPYTKDPPSDDFEPGSWSKDNAHTYQAWERAGYPGIYIYEQAPARAFDTTISDLHDLIREAAEEVFG